MKIPFLSCLRVCVGVRRWASTCVCLLGECVCGGGGVLGRGAGGGHWEGGRGRGRGACVRTRAC